MCLSFGEMISGRPTLGLPLWNGEVHICEALSTEQLCRVPKGRDKGQLLHVRERTLFPGQEAALRLLGG